MGKVGTGVMMEELKILMKKRRKRAYWEAGDRTDCTVKNKDYTYLQGNRKHMVRYSKLNVNPGKR